MSDALGDASRQGPRGNLKDGDFGVKGIPTLRINLDRNGVAAPAQVAAMVSTDVVAAGLTAFATSNLARPTMPNQFIQLQIHGPDMTSDERRTMYQNWLLAKGFQDLARGIRASLEEAALYLTLLSKPPRRIPTSTTLEELLDAMRKPATEAYPSDSG